MKLRSLMIPPLVQPYKRLITIRYGSEKWQTPKELDKLTMSDVSKKEGCKVLLKRLGKNHFKG